MKDFVIDQTSTSQNVPYDYKSIMHFAAYTGTSQAYPTIFPNFNSDLTILDLGNSNLPTEYDYLHINLLYCEGEFTTIIYLILTHTEERT